MFDSPNFAERNFVFFAEFLVCEILIPYLYFIEREGNIFYFFSTEIIIQENI